MNQTMKGASQGTMPNEGNGDNTTIINEIKKAGKEKAILLYEKWAKTYLLIEFISHAVIKKLKT